MEFFNDIRELHDYEESMQPRPFTNRRGTLAHKDRGRLLSAMDRLEDLVKNLDSLSKTSDGYMVLADDIAQAIRDTINDGY